MSLRKIESLEILFKDKIEKKRKQKILLSEDEKANLQAAEKEIEEKEKECEKKIKEKTALLKKEEEKIKLYRKDVYKRLGILTPMQLREKKKVCNLVEYRKILKINNENLNRCKKLVKSHLAKDKESKNLQVRIEGEINELKATKRRISATIASQYGNAWYLYGRTKYQIITKTIRNEHPYYIEVVKDLRSFYIESTSGVYRLSAIHFKKNWLISPLEEYITHFKNGEDIDIIRLHNVHNDGLFYLYGNNIYKATRPYYHEQLRLLILDLEDKERRKFERLKHKFSLSEKELKKRRDKIPENVRIAVWRRDEGKCVRCGSRKNLEYDHIIPVSKGGSNTERNIQILCEICNREKSDKI